MDQGTLRLAVGDPDGIGQIAGYLGRHDELSDGLAVRVNRSTGVSTIVQLSGEPFRTNWLPAAAVTNMYANLAVVASTYDFGQFAHEVERLEATGLRLRHRITVDCKGTYSFAEHGDVRAHIRDILRAGGSVLVESNYQHALHVLERLDIPPWAAYIDRDPFEVIVTVAANPEESEDSVVNRAHTMLVDNGGPAPGVTLAITGLEHVFPEVAYLTNDTDRVPFCSDGRTNVVDGFALRINDELHTELLVVGTSPTTVVDLR
jgi:hypothetical protein